jgi:NTP pyrophosphatase (non-canonical NTP hydrolase)
MDKINILTSSEQERLELLIEECSEVIQAASKVLRHGYESANPLIDDSPTNRENLNKELGHVQLIVNRMIIKRDLNEPLMTQAAIDKSKDINRWLHFDYFEEYDG